VTFGMHKCLHVEPFLNYLYEVWQLLSALYSDVRKKITYDHIYILGSKLTLWNFLQIPQLSIRSAGQKYFRRFLDISKFLTAISLKWWRYVATIVRTM